MFLCSGRLSVRTHAFHVCKRGSIPLPSTIIAPLAQSGLRRRPVTAEITGSNPVRCAKFMLSWMSGLNQHPAKVSSVVIWTVGSNPTLNAKFERHIAWILPSQEALGPATCLSPKRFGCLRILWPAGWEVEWYQRVVVFKPKGRWQCDNGTRREVGGSRVWWKTNWWVKTCWPNFWCGTITTGVCRAINSCIGGRAAHCIGLQIRKTVSSNLTRYSNFF